METYKLNNRNYKCRDCGKWTHGQVFSAKYKSRQCTSCLELQNIEDTERDIRIRENKETIEVLRSDYEMSSL